MIHERENQTSTSPCREVISWVEYSEAKSMVNTKVLLFVFDKQKILEGLFPWSEASVETIITTKLIINDTYINK